MKFSIWRWQAQVSKISQKRYILVSSDSPQCDSGYRLFPLGERLVCTCPSRESPCEHIRFVVDSGGFDAFFSFLEDPLRDAEDLRDSRLAFWTYADQHGGLTQEEFDALVQQVCPHLAGKSLTQYSWHDWDTLYKAYAWQRITTLAEDSAEEEFNGNGNI